MGRERRLTIFLHSNNGWIGSTVFLPFNGYVYIAIEIEGGAQDLSRTSACSKCTYLVV